MVAINNKKYYHSTSIEFPDTENAMQSGQSGEGSNELMSRNDCSVEVINNIHTQIIKPNGTQEIRGGIFIRPFRVSC